MAFPALRHFNRDEFDHPDLVDPELLLLVDEARHRLDLALPGTRIWVRNDARHHEDMVRIYGPDEEDWPNSPHQIRDDGFGHGLDLKMIPWNHKTRHAFVKACIQLEDEGRWPNQGIEICDGHIHVDNCPVLERPALWMGISR